MTSKIKILHITNLYPSMENVAYGVFVQEQIESLVKLGIECKVVFIDANSKGKQQYFTKINEIKRQAGYYDIIHCHHTYSAFITLFFAQVKRPVVTSFICPKGCEGKSNKYTWFKKSIYNYVQSRSAAFIVKNDNLCERNYPGKGYYVPNGVDLKFFTEIPRSYAFNKLSIPAKKYILFCSSNNHLRYEKRYDLFKETVEIIKERDQDVEELILSKEERSRVPLFFNAARVHLLTSDYEGSPNSVKEALACNTPIVSTNVGNVPSMINGLKGCHVAKSNQPAKLAAFVYEALQHDRIDGRERLIHLSFDMVSVAFKILRIYENVLAIHDQKSLRLKDSVGKA